MGNACWGDAGVRGVWRSLIAMVRRALVGICFAACFCRGQGVQVTSVDRTVVPVGSTMIFSGSGLTNATDVILHWFAFEHPAPFAIVSNADLSVTMPTVRQDVRAHYMSVRTPQGSTVGLPADTYDFTGPQPGPPPLFPAAIVVHAGATLVIPGDLLSDMIYVSAGGILECTGMFPDTIVFAEDGAVVDVTGATDASPSGVFYVSPGTIFLGTPPTGPFGDGPAVIEVPSISASPGIAMFYVGRELDVTVAGPGTVTVSPQMEYYPYNTLLTMTAHPASNGVFLAWSGGISSTVLSESTRIRSDMAVTATFTTGWQLTRYVGGGKAALRYRPISRGIRMGRS